MLRILKICVILIIIIIGDQWVMCSIKKLLELAKVRCHEVDCWHTHEVFYRIVSSYIEIDGICPNGHQFHWVSSDFHTTSKNAKISDSNLLIASGIILSGNSYAKITKCFVLCV